MVGKLRSQTHIPGFIRVLIYQTHIHPRLYPDNKGTEHVARGTCLPARGHVTSCVCVCVSSLQAPDVTADKNYINNTELDLVISTPVNNVVSLRFRVRVLISYSVRGIAVFSF